MSTLFDNENNETKLQQSNDKSAHISKYLKDESKKLSKRQSSEAQSINLAKEELSLK